MHRRLPNLAILLGLAGLIPFIVFGLAAMSMANPVRGARMLAILTAYGAVVLGFLGGVHWGLAVVTEPPAPPSDTVQPAGAFRTARSHLLLGAAPPLIGWLALLLAAFNLADVALAVVIGGYVATIVAEHQAHRTGALPSGYMWLRWGLSVVVVAWLVTVLVLRLLGARMVF